jgi:hypothetical protein
LKDLARPFQGQPKGRPAGAEKRPGRATESLRESKENRENNVDAEAGPAKVILPLITADSQVSEWFCEHRVSECLGFGQFGRGEAKAGATVRNRTKFFDSLVF